MSLEDGLVMQIHPGSLRNHNAGAASRASAATWAPTSRRRTDYVRALKPLLDRFGNEPRPDASSSSPSTRRAYSRELAPLAGHYPALKLGPAWWFYDCARGHAALPRADDRDGGLLQHRRLQRRHPRLPVDPGAARRGAAGRLRLSRRARGRRTGSTRTRRTRSPTTSPISLAKEGLQAVTTGAANEPRTETGGRP